MKVLPILVMFFALFGNVFSKTCSLEEATAATQAVTDCLLTLRGKIDTQKLPCDAIEDRALECLENVSNHDLNYFRPTKRSSLFFAGLRDREATASVDQTLV